MEEQNEKGVNFWNRSTGRRIFQDIKNNMTIVGFLDNDAIKWGKCIENIPVIGNGEQLENIDYDEIIICSLPGMDAIRKQLIEIGISANKINCEYISTQINARINFLRDFAELHMELPSDIAVAEGGVFQGDFAKVINQCFPKHKLYLFDTFEGFDERDTKKEYDEGFSVSDSHH